MAAKFDRRMQLSQPLCLFITFRCHAGSQKTPEQRSLSEQIAATELQC